MLSLSLSFFLCTCISFFIRKRHRKHVGCWMIFRIPLVVLNLFWKEWNSQWISSSSLSLVPFFFATFSCFSQRSMSVANRCNDSQKRCISGRPSQARMALPAIRGWDELQKEYPLENVTWNLKIHHSWKEKSSPFLGSISFLQGVILKFQKLNLTPWSMVLKKRDACDTYYTIHIWIAKYNIYIYTHTFGSCYKSIKSHF